MTLRAPAPAATAASARLRRVAAGAYPSGCTGAADPNYTIGYAPGTVTVAKAAQLISFLAPPTGAAGTSATLFATGGGSGNPVTFTLDPTVTKAPPKLTTAAGGSGVVGSPLTDTATLSGGASPTGTITFSLSNPGNTVVYTDHVPVHGNGTYTTAAGDNPGGYTPTLVGTYQWAVSYSGDPNNASATASAETQAAVYGFSGFTSPLPKSTLQKSGSTIPVKFRLTNSAGQPISATTAAALAAAGDVQATLAGPKITTVSTACTWNTTTLFFQCNIKTPTGLVTGSAYQISAQENVTGTFITAPAVSTAISNPETVYFK